MKQEKGIGWRLKRDVERLESELTRARMELANREAKTRERVQPKMGKMDIDYQKLHDAFFKFQTKPTVTGFGEMFV